MGTEYPEHVPLTFHRGSVTSGNGQELPNEAYLTYGSADGMNDRDAEIEIHGGGAHEAARMIDAAPGMLAALRVVGTVLAQRPITKKDDELWAAFSQVVAAVTKAMGGTP